MRASIAVLLLLVCANVMGCTAASDDPAQAGAAGAGAAFTGGATAVASEAVPCAVAAVLEQHCTRCHGASLRGGATVSFARASDFAQMRGAQTLAQEMLTRVPIDAAQRMPPPPAMPLNANEIAILSTWIQAGAAPAAAGCMVQTPAVMLPVRDASVSTGDPSTQLGDASVTADGGVLEGPNGDWAMFGGDLMSSRANLHETAISPSTVASLAPAWDVLGAATSSAPAVVAGVVYLPSWDGSVLALRVQDGTQVWKAMLPSGVDSSPAVSGDSVYLSDTTGSVHALNRATGAVRWSVRTDPHPQAHLWSSPIVIESSNLVVVGVASYEEVAFNAGLTFRGSVVGLDATTGSERFKIYTTAGNASEGPGVAVWGTVAVDEPRGLLYVGTGNNYKAPGSELSDSMLAIDYEVGSIVWSHQFLADDVFSLMGATGPDYDIGSTANLFTANGKDLVGIGIKSGVYVALDRDTGVVEWMRAVSPGGIFGGIVSAPAYANGTVFVTSNDAAAGETAVAALDAATGNVVWDARLPMQTFGGVAYANGLVFVGTLASTLTAFDAASGNVLWTEQLQDVAASPVIANGMLFIPWGYPITLSSGNTASTGGMTAYRL